LLTAVVLTHEHGDHANGAGAFARRSRIPLWVTAGTAQALGAPVCDAVPTLHQFGSHERFAIGDIELHPYIVPHDAREPCQFVFSDSAYPPSLKARIGGPHGHLDNEAAAALLARLDANRLQHIVAAHLSEKTNTPWLARTALGSSLGGETARVEIASQDGGLLWRELV